MGRTTWEQVFSSRLAESANSTTISASARQEPKALAAAPSEAAGWRPRGRSGPSANNGCFRSPRLRPRRLPKDALRWLRGAAPAAGWKRWPAARARETRDRARTSASLRQSPASQADVEFPPERRGSLPSPLTHKETAVAWELPNSSLCGLVGFFCACTSTYQFMM